MAVASIHLRIKGMHCTGCEDTIERAAAALPGVDKVRADYVKQMVAVEFDRRSPLVIGLLNGLMLGCGPLQAMYIMAAGTGSAQEGATMLFFFGLGTLV